MAELSPLRRRMIEDMTIRNMSPATQRSYISATGRSAARTRPQRSIMPRAIARANIPKGHLKGFAGIL
jgi:hypothetical protein